MQSVRKVTYAYDALGRRVSTTTLEGTVRHVYDGVQCIADLDSDGEVVARNRNRFQCRDISRRSEQPEFPVGHSARF